ncbi:MULTISPECIES: hypothetical protein [unclassified Rathayibacter]|uniref:hypothetical protein n=2 Tax=Rathayibacter TaxID=33886 RepID=UPI0011CE01CD|nr:MULTISPECIES: hypothetical protein [unclassified Rathayibacter]
MSDEPSGECQMNHRQRRAEVQQLVRDRGIPEAVSFEELVKHVERYRGTKIRFKQDPRLNGERVCGAWTGDPTTRIDTVHVPADAKTEVQLFIAGHELGHMLAETPGAETRLGDDPRVQEFLASVLNPGRVVPYAFHGIDDLTNEREARAEAIGDLLVLRILRGRRRHANRDFKFEQVFAG